MITHLKGTLTKKSPTEIVVDCNGVGYSVNISISTFEKLPDANSNVSILTYHHIREDAQLLFGFSSAQERDIFRLLISVSGIGPRMAQTILSGIQPEELIRTISHGNIGSLTSIPGVGKKTAERMIVELKDKVTKIDSAATVTGLTSSSIRSEALAALISLGYNRDKAEQSIRFVLNEANGADIGIEELIKKALQVTGK
ncbi:MAG: Holliday junction branch migration protein RuvA [Bacteroidota bacterium]|nr:Holliday junction branch migration protein RuvA [Bacteroidota bacterium]